MTEVQIVPLTRQEAEWVESRMAETRDRFNVALYPLAKVAAEGGQILAPYSDDEIRTYLTKIAIKARRSS